MSSQPERPSRRSNRKRRRILPWTDESQNVTSLDFAPRPSVLEESVELNSSPDGPLCKICKAIDFDELFNSEVRSTAGERVLDIGLLNKDVVWRGCILCRFFFQMRAEPGYGAKFSLRAHSAYTILVDRGPESRSADVVLSVEPQEMISESLSALSLYRDFSFVAQDCQAPNRPPSSRMLYRGAPVHPLNVNYKALRTWLERCEETHAGTCGQKRRDQPIPLLAIDCTTREVVPITEFDVYVALSYVWGSTHLPESCISISHNSRSKRLPSSGIVRTVEDAMVAVKNLGLKYLWVDKYCISQSDDRVRAQQIRNMDQIYEQAYATIIASAGPDASAGLPGVGSIARRLQPSVNLHEKRLVSTLCPLRTALRGSVWMSRGWTYQEFTLSRRCLFFTDRQVYFMCSSMSCCEAVISGQDDTTLTSKLHPGFLSASIFGNTKPGPELREFVDQLAQYTSRALTFESDALDAFRGILSRSRFWTYYGIPIAPYNTSKRSPVQHEIHTGFAKGLYWLPQSKGGWSFASLQRRREFSSWSWAGWKGRIEYPGQYGPAGGHEGNLMTVDNDRSKACFWVEGKDCHTIPLHELWEGSPNENRSIPELSNYIQVEATTFLLRFQPGVDRAGQTFRLCICECHLATAHEGVVEYKDRWEDVILCTPPTKADEYYDRLTSRLWTCILLFVGLCDENRYLYNLLVVEWKGDVAYRIGAITLRCYSETLQEKLQDLGVRQRIRLG